MKRSYALFAVIFAVSILIGIQAVKVIEANPVIWPTTPILDKPTVTIESPTNNTAYNNSEIYVNLTVTNPDSWRREGEMPISPSNGVVKSVTIYVDGSSIFSTSSPNINFSAVKIWDDGSRHYSIPNQSSPGQHVLNVTVLSYSYYRGPAYNGSHLVSDIYSSSGPVYQYPMVVSDTVYFTTQQPENQTSFQLNQTTLTALAIVIVIVSLTSASLVIRRKKP